MKEKISCSEQTKRKLANGLKELMITTPYSKITIFDISKQCNTHRQTFYYHFKDKSELLDWLVNYELIERFSKDICYENMYDKFKEAFETMYDNADFYKNVFSINADDIYKFVSFISTEKLATIIEDIGKKNGIATDKNIEIISEFFGFGFAGVAIKWAQKGMKETPEEMTEIIKSFIDNLVEIIKIKQI